MRRVPLLVFSASLVACFTPEDTSSTNDGSSTDATDGTSSSTDVTSGPGGTSETGSTTTETPTTGNPLCGNGELDPGESCDDGVNDGAYGGCEPDCSDAAFCGDAEVNGPEDCDDGENLGGYGGCESDCTFAEFCGDAELNGPELCDNGDANEDGSACNIDCTTAGAIIGTFESEPFGAGGDTSDVPNPQFNSNSEVLVGIGNNFQGAFLFAIDNDTVEVSRTFEPLLPEPGIRSATMVGDTWILSAGDCNYSITVDGEFAEVCAPMGVDRTSGLRDLVGVTGGYVGLNRGDATFNQTGQIAGFDLVGGVDGSPDPQWTVDDPNTEGWLALAGGPADSVYACGDNGTFGVLAQYSSAGNEISTDGFTEYDEITRLAIGPDGSIAALVFIQGEGVFVVKLSTDLDEVWRTSDFITGGERQVVTDQQGDVILFYDTDGAGSELTKFDGEDGQTVWDRDLPEPNISTLVVSAQVGLSVAPDNRVWVGYSILTPTNDAEQLWLGRIAP